MVYQTNVLSLRYKVKAIVIIDKNNNIMNKLVNNAKNQAKRFGNVNVRHYFDRSYQDYEDLTISLEDAIELIKEVLFSPLCTNEDIHISAVR